LNLLFGVILVLIILFGKILILGQSPTRYWFGMVLGVSAVMFAGLNVLTRARSALLMTLPEGVMMCDAPGIRCRFVDWVSVREIEFRSMGSRIFATLVCDDRLLSVSKFIRNAESAEQFSTALSARKRAM